MIPLPDVNLLVATFDSEHVFHRAARNWWQSHRPDAWATCAITENGFVRVAMQAHTKARITAVKAARDLKQFQQSYGQHVFWLEKLSVLDENVFDLDRITSGRHSTDIYLAGLAHVHGGKLVTFDRSIPWQAVRGATAELVEVLD